MILHGYCLHNKHYYMNVKQCYTIQTVKQSCTKSPMGIVTNRSCTCNKKTPLKFFLFFFFRKKAQRCYKVKSSLGFFSCNKSANIQCPIPTSAKESPKSSIIADSVGDEHPLYKKSNSISCS